MKKILLFLLGLIATQMSFSQTNCEDPIIANFECENTLALPATVTKIANSFSSGINTSENIGQYTDNGTEGFDALIIEYASAIDLSVNNQLKFKIYSPNTSIQILAKLEGGTQQEIYSSFSAIATWEEFTFDFSASNGNGNTKIVLFFNVTKTDGTATDLYYFDDLRWDTAAGLNVKTNSLVGVDIFKTSSNSLKIEGLDAKKASLKMYNILGSEVLSKSFDASVSKEIVLGNTISKGIYIVKLETNKGILTKKILME